MDEWTRAEIGVGAAIAMGSQEEKGKIADLVINAIRRRERMGEGKREDEKGVRVAEE